MAPYLCHLGLLGVHVQQHADGLGVALAGGDVQGGVARRGGGVGVGFVLQEQLHHLLVAHPRRAVQRRLVVLGRRGVEDTQNQSLDCCSARPSTVTLSVW